MKNTQILAVAAIVVILGINSVYVEMRARSIAMAEIARREKRICENLLTSIDRARKDLGLSPVKGNEIEDVFRAYLELASSLSAPSGIK